MSAWPSFRCVWEVGAASQPFGGRGGGSLLESFPTAVSGLEPAAVWEGPF